MEVKVELAGWKRVRKAGLPPYFASRIAQGLTFDNRAWTDLVKHRPNVLARMRRMGEELPPRKLQFWREDDLAFYVPRGFDLGATEEVVADYRVTAPATWREPTGGLRDIQADAAAAWEDQGRPDMGCFIMPTGSGKTIFCLELARRTGERAIILSDRDESGLKNWVADAEKYLGMEVGVVGGGRDDWEGRTVVVAMFQTLWSRRKELLPRLTEAFGVCIVDEMQIVPAETFCQVTNAFRGRRRYGVTATERRKDGLEAVAFATLGPVLFERRTAKEIAPVGVVTVRTGIALPALEECQNDYSRSMKIITLNDARNAVLVRKIDEMARGRHCLVVTHRVRHAKVIANGLAALRGTTDRMGVLIGSVKGQEKRCIPVDLVEGMPHKPALVKKMAIAGELEITVATYQYAYRGLDIPIWDTLFLATPTGDEMELTQVIGRIRRAFEGKDKAWVVDFVDFNGICIRYLAARRKVYERLARQAAQAAQDERQGSVLA